MKLLIFIALIITIIWIGYFQSDHPTPYGGEPKPSQIINLPEDVKREAGIQSHSFESNRTITTSEPIVIDPALATPAMQPMTTTTRTTIPKAQSPSAQEAPAIQAIEEQLDTPEFLQTTQ